MLGILFQLAISWLLLYFFKKQNLNALGFLTKVKNYRISLIFFLFTALLATSQQAFEAWLEGSEWILNQNFSASQFFSGLWQDVKSVVFEELIFRGVLLFLILDRFGSKKAKIASAISFGIYHWFSFGIFGQIVPMIIIFGGTGFMGWALAKAFIRSSSI